VINNSWKIKTNSPPKKNSKWLLDVLAKNRGLTTPKKLADFLNPKLEHILEVQLTETQKAVTRILKARSKKEKIIVYSDYDADGICATAIMWETIFDLGTNVLPYVPHRIKEGYGLSTGAITKLAKDKVKLIITVDHGVTAASQIEHAKNLGVDVIVTDHHVLPQKLPRPLALVHTVDLCGAGVSWRLCWEIVKAMSPAYKEKLIEKLELASLATIADLVPLIGASRAIVKLGLEKISQTKRPGIKALIKASNINRSITTYELGHILAPRINAMGRIEHAIDSLRLLCAKNARQADELSQLLSKTNSLRQDLTTKAFLIARDLVEEKALVQIISHEDLHEGVIGLVAARLVEIFYKPAIVIAKGKIYSKGSARSIPGFNIVEAIRSSSEYLVDGGGHPMAAGFTIETRHIETFRQKIQSYASAKIVEGILNPTVEIECELQKEDINRNSLEIIKEFEPYGVSNPNPVFLTRNMLVEDVRCVGNESQHLKLQVDGINAIGFNMGQMRAKIRPGYQIDLVYALQEDSYNGNGSIQLKIKDLTVSV